MNNSKKLALDALAKALWLRKQLGIKLDESVSPIDSAERLGVEVRLVDLPSMEGIYTAGGTKNIFLSSLRPQGRRSFTCAHELGHHVFGHGDQFDELATEKTPMRQRDPKEFSADCFAAYFLMPKATVDNGLKRRGLVYASLGAVDVYRLASWLGVGYRTLINHLLYGLRAISREQASHLLREEPRMIRRHILGQGTEGNLHVVDEHWLGRAIDCEVGDIVLFPKAVEMEGYQFIEQKNILDKKVFKVIRPGIMRASIRTSVWSAFIRVSPSSYVGRSCFRFEEEVNE